MAHVIFCRVRTSINANTVVIHRTVAGFPANDISILKPDNKGTKDLAVDDESKSPEGAPIGACTGAVPGGGLGRLLGIGALPIPGVGSFFAAGPIAAALASAAISVTASGVSGAWIGLGIPEWKAKKREGKIKGRRCLISVHCETADESNAARKIFENGGAEDITTSREASIVSKSCYIFISSNFFLYWSFFQNTFNRHTCSQGN